MDDGVRALEKMLYVNGYTVINIGHPEVVETAYIAESICRLLDLEPTKYIELVDLPERMTLEKWPGLEKQKQLLSFEPAISIEEGIKRVVKNLRKTLQFEEGT